MKNIVAGSLVKDLKGRTLGEVLEVLANTYIIETGSHIVIKHKIDVKELFSPMNEVYVRDSNIKLTIGTFYYSDTSERWKAVSLYPVDGQRDFDVRMLEKGTNL